MLEKSKRLKEILLEDDIKDDKNNDKNENQNISHKQMKIIKAIFQMIKIKFQKMKKNTIQIEKKEIIFLIIFILKMMYLRQTQ